MAVDKKDTVKDPRGMGPNKDPAADVADPAVEESTNPGPGANSDPFPPLAPAGTTQPRFVGSSINRVNQPVVPAPSEQRFPGGAGRPDPSRTVEEQDDTAAAHIEAHALRPGLITSDEGTVLPQTVDGNEGAPSNPKPMGDKGPKHAGNTEAGVLGIRPMPIRKVD